MLGRFSEAALSGSLDDPFVIVAGRKDHVTPIYTYLEGLMLTHNDNVLNTWFDGSYMILVFGKPGSSMLRLTRNYLSDYLYRKPDR
jgi:hypothetical protein